MYHGRTATFAITLAVLMLTIVPVFTQFSPIHTVAATKPQPPPSSTSATWAKAYNIPYSYSVAESIAQTSSGGYVVGASCTADAIITSLDRCSPWHNSETNPCLDGRKTM